MLRPPITVVNENELLTYQLKRLSSYSLLRLPTFIGWKKIYNLDSRI